MKNKDVKENRFWKTEYLNREVSLSIKHGEIYRKLVASGMSTYQAYVHSRKVKA